MNGAIASPGRLNALHWAAVAGALDKVEELLSSNSIDLDAPSQELIPRTALHYASEAGHASIVAKLLAAGANLEAKDANGYTALHIAANRGALDAMNALLAAGADPNARTSADSTPLHLAAYACHAEVVDLLVAAGAKADAKSRDGSTPLTYAALHGCLDMVAALLQAGANIQNANDNSRRSPLYYAAREGHVAVAALLIQSGADFEWDGELLPWIAGPALAAAGYRRYSKLPKPCPGLDQALLDVWWRHPEHLPQLFARLEEGAKHRVRTTLLCLHRRMPWIEEKLRMWMLQVGIAD